MLYKFLALYLLSGNPEGATIINRDYHQVSSRGTLIQEHHWVSPPTIVVCNSISIKPDRLKSALKFWESIGYTFEGVYFASKQDYACASGIPLRNQIMIDIPSSGFPFGKHIGNTKTWHKKESGEIMKVKIEIAHGWGSSARVLEHELGHAIGWNDFSQTGHIMNGIWAQSGYKTKGLEKKNGYNNN